MDKLNRISISKRSQKIIIRRDKRRKFEAMNASTENPKKERVKMRFWCTYGKGGYGFAFSNH